MNSGMSKARASSFAPPSPTHRRVGARGDVEGESSSRSAGAEQRRRGARFHPAAARSDRRRFACHRGRCRSAYRSAVAPVAFTSCCKLTTQRSSSLDRRGAVAGELRSPFGHDAAAPVRGSRRRISRSRAPDAVGTHARHARCRSNPRQREGHPLARGRVYVTSGRHQLLAGNAEVRSRDVRAARG